MTNEQRMAKIRVAAEGANRTCAWLSDVRDTGETDNVVVAHAATSLVVHQLVDVARDLGIDIAEMEREIERMNLREAWLHERATSFLIHSLIGRAFN